MPLQPIIRPTRIPTSCPFFDAALEPQDRFFFVSWSYVCRLYKRMAKKHGTESAGVEWYRLIDHTMYLQ